MVARWDGALTEAMQMHGMAIDEKALADVLVPDLDRRLTQAVAEACLGLP